VENPESIRPAQSVEIELEAEDREGLFVDWLRELIYRFETDHLLFSEFDVRLTNGNRLCATCRGEVADWSRHMPDNELKAVTYHGLRISEVKDGWEAEVIFDI
jgi:SHS2 domain-containing protein